MANVVWGTDCIFQVDHLGTLLPVFCAKSFSLSRKTNVVEITGASDGFSKDFDYDTLEYTLSLDGLIVVLEPGDNPIIFDLMNVQSQFLELAYKMIFTDPLLNVKTIEGVVLVLQSDLNVAAGAFGEFSVEFLGKGDFTLT